MAMSRGHSWRRSLPDFLPPDRSRPPCLLDVMVFPDYGCVEIGDVGSRNVEAAPSGTRLDGPTNSTDYAVYLYTMSVDEAIQRDQDVRVRFYCGEDRSELGTLVF